MKGALGRPSKPFFFLRCIKTVKNWHHRHWVEVDCSSRGFNYKANVERTFEFLSKKSSKTIGGETNRIFQEREKERENCQVWEFFQSLYPFLPCHLSAQFYRVFLTKCRWLLTFQGDPARSFLCLFALARRIQHTEANQAAKALSSVCQHCPKPPTPHPATGAEGSRSSGGKGHPGTDSCSKGGREGTVICVFFKESKWSIHQLMPKIELYLNCTALLENSQLS